MTPLLTLPERLTVTVQQAMSLTGLGRNSIFKELKEGGRLEKVKVGARTLVTYKSLLALVEPVHKSGYNQSEDCSKQKRAKANDKDVRTNGNSRNRRLPQPHAVR